VLQFPIRAFDWVTCLGQNRSRDYGKHEFTIPIECSITQLLSVYRVKSVMAGQLEWQRGEGRVLASCVSLICVIRPNTV